MCKGGTKRWFSSRKGEQQPKMQSKVRRRADAEACYHSKQVTFFPTSAAATRGDQRGARRYIPPLVRVRKCACAHIACKRSAMTPARAWMTQGPGTTVRSSPLLPPSLAILPHKIETRRRALQIWSVFTWTRYKWAADATMKRRWPADERKKNKHLGCYENLLPSWESGLETEIGPENKIWQTLSMLGNPILLFTRFKRRPRHSQTCAGVGMNETNGSIELWIWDLLTWRCVRTLRRWNWKTSAPLMEAKEQSED